jgi:hypothetical protein
MRRVILMIAAVLICLAVPSSRAADFWKKKGYAEWSDKEIQKMLNDSPWAKEASEPGGARGGIGTGSPDATMSGGRSRGAAGAVGAGAPSGEGGEASVRRAGGAGGGRPGGGGPAMNLLVRWTSALPVKQAMVRLRFGSQASSGDAAELLAREEPAYMLTVHNLPRRLAAVDPAQLKEALRKTVRLDRKGKESLRPDEVQVARTDDGGIVVIFAFPKTNPITLDDKNVEFFMQLGPTEFRCKFNLSDMAIDGKPAL